MLMVYCVDIIRLNHFTIENCVFYCGACHCFYRWSDVFLLCILDHILECDIFLMYLFLPYCVRKWHNKTVQSINQSTTPLRAFSAQGVLAPITWSRSQPVREDVTTAAAFLNSPISGTMQVGVLVKFCLSMFILAQNRTAINYQSICDGNVSCYASHNLSLIIIVFLLVSLTIHSFIAGHFPFWAGFLGMVSDRVSQSPN